MMIQKKHETTICGGMVTLIRWFVGDSPDECGSTPEYEAQIWPIYSAIPFPDFWRKFKVRGLHMDSPEMEEETKNKIVNLQDYDLTKAGYQVAAGLNFGVDHLDIGFFPEGWKPEDPPMIRPITPESRQRSLSVIGHESGHFHAAMVGYRQTQTAIRRDITRLFDALSPIQAENLDERWAEVFRAFFGGPGARGAFSDNKPYTEADNPKLYSLMAGSYWLQAWLANVDYTDLQIWGAPDQNENRILWRQWNKDWLGNRYPDAWYSLDRNFRRWRWTSSGTWIAA